MVHLVAWTEIMYRKDFSVNWLKIIRKFTDDIDLKGL